MPSTFFGLNISKSGLSAYQASINTTAHNISNASTDGYSRQNVTKRASDAIRTHNTYGAQGSGVDIISVDRERNSYYDTKYWNNHCYYGQYQAKQDFMSQIENYFNEIDKDGFTTEFDKFFNALVDLTSEPSSSNKKVTATSYASSLMDYFNSLSESLTAVQEDANDQIKSVCDRINSISDQLLSINKQIQAIEITGQKANDLRDQREILVDELSLYVNVTVQENDIVIPGAVNEFGEPLKAGITDYNVYINDQLLADNLKSNHLVCTPRQKELAINDRSGLYEVTWNFEDGIKFDLNSSGMDGQLKGLFDIRDGNNAETFKGTVSASVGDTSVTLEADHIKSINRINIPDEGVLTIGSFDYEYSNFTINYDAKGEIASYTFDLKDPVKKAANQVVARVGEDVDYKGIPYYQAQLNEFVRTFAQEFNTLHNQGTDAAGNKGLDVFTADNNVTGDQMEVIEDGDDALKGAVVSAKKDSYYRITAANVKLNKNIEKDSNLFCTRYPSEQGVESCDLLKKLVDLKSDQDMFSQGNPAEFLQAVVADISVDSSKASNFEKSLTDVLQTIDNQRASISGVDTNEELANLVIYQNGYNLCSRMISVFNQIYDKLINQTAV